MGPVNTMGQDSLERAVREADIEVPPLWFDEVGSTNDEARRLAREGAPEWTVVAAGHQTAGRGRLGRSWEDLPGRALLCSVVLRPRRSHEEAPVLGLWAATAMIAAAGEPSLRAKWPNDLVLGDRKVGGILTEAWVDAGRLAHVVVGAGVNLGTGETDLPRQLRSTAATLAADPDVLLVRFLKALRPGADLPAGTLLERYRPLCSTLGRTVRATAVTGEQLEGVAVDLDARGGLVVEADGGRATVAFGEAALLR